MSSLVFWLACGIEAVGVASDASDGNILVKARFQIVAIRNLVLLAAFFMEAYPAAAALTN